MEGEKLEQIKTDNFFQRLCPQEEQRNRVDAEGRKDQEIIYF